MKRLSLIVITALVSVMGTQAQSVESSDSLARELQEIVVTAKYPVTKLVGNSLVSTISGSNLQDLGTCLDVLAQLPMITVEDDGVSVVGKGKPEIFIDGRPLRDVDELRQLQSSNIRKVELLLAPGAMYSSDTKAVVKIVTKRDFFKGLSLIERAEATVRRKWSANDMLDVNYRFGGWDIFATGSVAYSNSLIKGSTTNTLVYEGVKTVVGSSQNNIYPTTTGVIKAGFNFSGGEQSLGGYYRFNPERGDFVNKGSEWLNEEMPLRRDINRNVEGNSHLVSVYYDNLFGEKYHLHFDGNYRSSMSKNSIVTSYPDPEASDVASNDKRRSTLWAGKVYTDFPLWNGSFVIGSQASYTHTTLDYHMQNSVVAEYIPSSFSDSEQTSVAAFTSWSRVFGKLSLSAGLRYEYVNYLFKENDIKDNDVSRIDNLLTPDLSLSWNINEEAQASVSYRMATIKPPYSQLTGSLSYVGQHEIEGGNPSLRDERMHDIQLFGIWKGFMMQADFTRSVNTYSFVKRLYPASNLQLMMQPINIDVSAFDLYLIWNKNIRAWTPNLTVGMHRQWLGIEGVKYNRPIFSYYFDNLFSLPKGWLVTVNVFGQSKGDMHTNRFGGTWMSMDVSIGRSFLNKALQLKLSATDIFNTLNNDWTMNTYGVRVDKRQLYDRRGVSLSVTYRFQPKESKYKGKNASDTELNRL